MRRLATTLGAALALLLLGSSGASADTATDIAAAQQQQQLIDAVRSQLGSNLADALAAQDQLTKSLQENAAQQAAVQQQIDDINARIAVLDDQIAKLDDDIATTDQRLSIERTQLRSLARAIYVQPSSMLLEMAEARNLNDLITRVQDLNSAGARAHAVRDSLNRDADRLQTDHDKQAIARDQQLQLRAKADADMDALKKLQQQQEDSKAKLETKISETKYELTALNGQSAQLAQQITDLLQKQQDEIIAAAMQQVWDQVKLATQNGVPSNIVTSANHSKQYRFMWPEPGSQVVQGFGPTTLWFEPPFQGFPHFHTGIDTVLPEGSPILAADDGVVVLVGSGTTGYGNYIVLAHQGGLDTLYGHLSKALVKVGDQVMQGQPIGLEGSTGNSTGPHLHFELRINSQPVDPAPYLPPGPPSNFRG